MRPSPAYTLCSSSGKSVCRRSLVRVTGNYTSVKAAPVDIRKLLPGFVSFVKCVISGALRSERSGSSPDDQHLLRLGARLLCAVNAGIGACALTHPVSGAVHTLWQ